MKIEEIPTVKEFETIDDNSPVVENIQQDQESTFNPEEQKIQTEIELKQVRESLFKSSPLRKIAAGMAFMGVVGSAGNLEAKEDIKPIKKDPILLRVGRTVGHVSTSFVKNVYTGIYNDIKDLVRTPQTIGEVVMGRDFDKHEPITGKQKLERTVGVVANVGTLGVGIATSGVSTVGEVVGKGILISGGMKTVVDYNKESLDHIKEKMLGNGNDDRLTKINSEEAPKEKKKSKRKNK